MEKAVSVGRLLQLYEDGFMEAVARSTDSTRSPSRSTARFQQALVETVSSLAVNGKISVGRTLRGVVFPRIFATIAG